MTQENEPFIIEQLEEALEERQNPDRRRLGGGFEGHSDKERRKGDRRTTSQAAQ